MVIYICDKCKKEFTKKSNFISHTENKKRPCTIIILSDEKEDFVNPHKTSFLSLKNDTTISNLIDKNQHIEKTECEYCGSFFTRFDNLKRHIKYFCKSKKYYDELDKLKEKVFKMNLEVNKLKVENDKLKSDTQKVFNTINTTNNIDNVNNINNFNVQLVQFGDENIEDIDIKEAVNTYINSTGANIVSNILRLTNFNVKHPQNHNICISDLSRELVKIYNGDKFIIKKFKNIKEHILNKVVKNAYEIVKKIETDSTIKKTSNAKSKIKINNVSLKLIDGVCPEDIVAQEIIDVENKLLTDNNRGRDEYSDTDKKIELTLEHRQRIKHLENKQEGLINIAYDRLKDELYNGRTYINNS
jgi:DNA-directed RNA polymerase subunit RPC12/RpoP